MLSYLTIILQIWGLLSSEFMFPVVARVKRCVYSNVVKTEMVLASKIVHTHGMAAVYVTVFCKFVVVFIYNLLCVMYIVATRTVNYVWISIAAECGDQSVDFLHQSCVKIYIQINLTMTTKYVASWKPSSPIFSLSLKYTCFRVKVVHLSQ